MRVVAPAGLAAVLIMTSACGSGSPAPGSSAPPSAELPSATSPAPASSAALLDCGRFTLSQGEGIARTAAQCLITAAGQGTAAELFVTRPTIEGDPIRLDYRVQADRSIRLVTDSRQDRFGNREITAQVCTGPRFAEGKIGFADCSTGAGAADPGVPREPGRKPKPIVEPTASSTAIPIPSRPPAKPPRLPATVSPGPG